MPGPLRKSQYIRVAGMDIARNESVVDGLRKLAKVRSQAQEETPGDLVPFRCVLTGGFVTAVWSAAQL